MTFDAMSEEERPLGEDWAGVEDIRVYFDERIAGRAATCEGGGPIEGTNMAHRATYIGHATGRRLDQGNPPWRWLELIAWDPDSSTKEEQYVWCEENFVFFEDEED